jgi:glycosyl transferase family 2
VARDQAAAGARGDARAQLIAFGSAIADAEAYRRYAEPGIRRAAEPDSEVLVFAAAGPPGRSANLILEAAARHDDLEALVMVHPNTEIATPRLCGVVRDFLEDASVGAIGATGANGVRGLAWWEGEVVSADVTHRYEEFHGGELPALSWTPHLPPPAEVQTLDGQLLVLSPWVVRNVRFDEELVLGHGFDVDFCASVRAAGRRLIVADLPAVHHRSLELVDNLEIWIEAHIAIAEKLDSALAGSPNGSTPEAVAHDPWRRRARVAEARREAARAIAFSKILALDAQVAELERELKAITDSPSWRLTAPLRTLNAARRRRLSAR